MRIQTVIERMLTEPCAKSLCDSGSAYGYQYEYRKEKKLEAEPVCSIEWDVTEEQELRGYITKSLYHHMVEHLKYDWELTRALNRFFKKEVGKPAYINVDLFEKFVKSHKDWELNGSDNTYNYDNILDGVFVFTQFNIGTERYDDDYLIISTHNGCDVRGGYSTPKVFSCYDSYMFLSPVSFLSCENGCPESELDEDGVGFSFDKDEWSYQKEPDKFLYKPNEGLYCPVCGGKMILTC